MKKLLLLISLLAFAITSQAQKLDFWLDAGLKIQYGGSLFLNSGVSNDDNFDLTFATSTKVGGKLGINWNYTGLALDVLVGETRGQFQNTSAAGLANQEISLSTVDIYLLFRDARQKGYFEIGPKVSLVGDVRNNAADAPMETIVNEDYYNAQPLSAVVGFGTYILGGEGSFSGILGLRFEYGFSDIVSDTGSSIDRLPANRQPVNYAGDPSSTNPIFAGLVFELNWGIGGVGQERCGERAKFIFF